MEVETAMEVDGAASAPSPSSKRLTVKNAIQTNFGDDYVFQIAANASQESSHLALSLSSNTIKFYSAVTSQYVGECRGHSGTIHEISFSVPSSPQTICSCSSDGTVRAWDVRTFKQVSSLSTTSSQELYSFSFGGSSGNLLAGGSNTQIFFWDWRNGNHMACLEESHMDDVTQVKFVPNQNKLISSSVDGLMCLFDTSGPIDDDDHLNQVMNVETSIAKIGFFGSMNQKLWCMTHIETLSIWDWKNARREVNFEDARSLASNKWNLDDVDYFVDCHYSEIDDRLWAIGGTGSGTLGYFPIINNDHVVRIGIAEAILEGGHAGVVRSVLPASGTHSPISKDNVFCWTGGEDGRLCCWSSDESPHSWISKSLAMRSHKDRGKRHHPY